MHVCVCVCLGVGFKEKEERRKRKTEKETTVRTTWILVKLFFKVCIRVGLYPFGYVCACMDLCVHWCVKVCVSE